MSQLQWVKSSFSEEGGNNCVEVAATNAGIALRESESPAHVLTMDRALLGALVRHVKADAAVEPPVAPR